MLSDLPQQEAMPVELRELVKISVLVFGKVVERSVGRTLYQKIEGIRQDMADLRNKNNAETTVVLRRVFSQLKLLKPAERRVVACAYTLMLEVMNTCENAYRSYRLTQNFLKSSKQNESVHTESNVVSGPQAIIYVLTAHPTEARSPENIAAFHLIQRQLISALENLSLKSLENTLYHSLELAWRTSIVRNRAPSVLDEAAHIYSTLLERTTLDSLLEASHLIAPLYIRSWVGGDKDGHPGVDEKVMHQSLSLSRSYIIKIVYMYLSEAKATLKSLGLDFLQKDFSQVMKALRSFQDMKSGDGLRIKKLRQQIQQITQKYKKEFHSLHPSLIQLQRLLHVFPALVVPLELRESSDVLMSDQRQRSSLAIDRMLRLLASLSKGGSPKWYVRGFIISMASSFEHLQVAAKKVRFALGKARIPVIPLFEQAEALRNSSTIIKEWVQNPRVRREMKEEWGNFCEMMVGYSDSAKESGVLFSRLEIAQAMHQLDQLCLDEKVQPLFFQGSGGSVDRGGGSIQDQIAWWPQSALLNYKVTVQGEMVERSLASPEITRGQIERIAKSVSHTIAQSPSSPHLEVLKEFAASVANTYKTMIHDPIFLELVEYSTPYSHLNELHIGSRPSRRTQRLAVSGLRAIPWVLCWTQTRILFPTWWGIGSSWKSSSYSVRENLKKAFVSEPVFASYIRALGFTLAKVELSVWRIYLEQSGINPEVIENIFYLFEQEFQQALEMVQFISGDKNPLWFNHRLGASIRLRSPMIHPLNLLQILAIQEKDPILLRLTVTGISSGMLTTG